MKRILLLLPIGFVFANCGTPKPIRGTGNAPVVFNSPHKGNAGNSNSADNPNDTVAITGSQYIPLLGRNEAGVQPFLVGSWVLQSVPGSEGSLKNTNKISPTKTMDADMRNSKNYNGTIIDDRMKNSKELRRDSVTTKTKNGVTHTETTVYLINKDEEQGNKITPPQGSNYHIPEPPSISFYGSNETFSGFTGCNKISGRYSMTGNKISFSNASPSTKMVCIGDYDENAFVDALRRVDSYKASAEKLELMEGSKVILVFSRK